jgi:acetyl esterase/lipase
MLGALSLSACNAQGNQNPSPSPPPSPSPSPSPTPPASSCAGTGTTQHLNIAYKQVAGTNPNLLSLDLYEPTRPTNCPPAPIVVYVHGGGFKKGDKKNKVADKIKLFNSEGWAFASINYRLSPEPPSNDPNRVKYPIHEQDIAAALGWLRANATQYRMDPKKFLLMGHSAGAFLVALVSTDAQFVNAEGIQLEDILCTAPLDTETYSVTDQVAANDDQSQDYRNAFGDDPAVWAKASPINNIAPNKGLPDFLLFTRGSPVRARGNQQFADALKAASVQASVVNAEPYSHEQVNEAVGKPGDTIVTPPLMNFFRGCVGSSNGSRP